MGRLRVRDNPGKGESMDDVYVVRNEDSVSVHKGQRRGKDRRISGTSAKLVKLGKYAANKRKNDEDRRQGYTFTFKERVFERIGSLTNGTILLGAGLFAILIGLTILPVIGIVVGLYIIFQSFGVFAEVFQKLE